MFNTAGEARWSGQDIEGWAAFGQGSGLLQASQSGKGSGEL